MINDGSWLIIVALCLLVLFLSREQHKEAKRTADLQAAATALSVQFFPAGETSLALNWEHFALPTQGHSAHVFNVMLGRVQGHDLALFDYEYLFGSGRSSYKRRQSVLCFYLASNQLPGFRVRSGYSWRNLLPWVDHKFLEFASHPGFSQRHLVTTRDEPDLRRHFTTQVLDFYERHGNLYTECDGERLLLYRLQHRVAPEAVRLFIQQGVYLLHLLLPSVANEASSA